MKIKVFNIDYDISREDIEDSVNYVLEVQDLLFADEDLSEIDVDMGIADAVEYGDWAIIFSDLDDDTIYYYHITDVDEADERVHCTLFDIQDYFGPDGKCHEIAESLPEFMMVKIKDDELDTICLDDLIADLISNESDFLVQGFDWEEVEE